MLTREKYLDERILKTKKKLIVAVSYLLKKKDFSMISVINIVEKANISRTTFYNHFQNKEELLTELIEKSISNLVDKFQKTYQNYKWFNISDIKPASVYIFDYVYQNSDFFTTIANSDISLIFQNEIIQKLIIVLEQDLKVNHPKINHKLYAIYIAYATTGVMVEWIRNNYKYSPSYMAKQILEIVSLPSDQKVEKNK